MDEPINAKEFGKLTADQLLTLLQWFPLLEPLQDELRQEFLKEPAKIDRVAPDGFQWAELYEQPIHHHLARFVIALGEAPALMKAVINSADPQQAILDKMRREANESDGVESPDSATVPLYQLINMLWSLFNSLECVAIYGCYLHELIAEAGKPNGKASDSALLKAIRIDPCAVNTPTAVRRISLAALFDDKEFLHDLGLAMEGKTGDQTVYLRKFRVALKALAESGGIGDSPKALASRLVELGIYPDAPSAIKNAAELIRKAKINNAI